MAPLVPLVVRKWGGSQGAVVLRIELAIYLIGYMTCSMNGKIDSNAFIENLETYKCPLRCDRWRIVR